MTLTVATANVDKALRGTKLQQAVRAPANAADVVAYQEVERLRHVKAVASLPGFEVYLPAGRKRSWRNACPVAWRTSAFGPSIDRGLEQIGKGIANVQPNRVAEWEMRPHLSSGLTVAAVSSHTVSGVWKNLKRKFQQWLGRNRRQESDRELAEISDLAQRLKQRADVVLVMGDLNRAGQIPASKIGCDRIIYAMKPTHGKKWFDVIGLIGATGSGARRIGTPSDHDVLVATITMHSGDHKPAKPQPKPKKEAAVPRGFMPGAIVKNIRPGSNDPAITPCGVIGHIAVSRSDSLHGLFTDDGGIESHFYIRTDGTIEQYRSIYYEADAQAAGNSFIRDGKRVGFVSVETEGMGPGTWTAAQIASFQQIVVWVHSESPFPLRKCPAWNEPGVGYHRLFREWNPNSHSCPGDARVKQFEDVIVPWLDAGASTTTEEDQMADMRVPVPKNSPQYDRVKSKDHTVAVDTGISMLWYEVERLADQKAEDIADRVAAKVATKSGLTKADITAAVKDALREGTK